MTITVGMLCTPKAAASSGSSSTLTLPTFIFPSYSPAISAIIGASMRHGPHHDAQKSTSTGMSQVVSSLKLSLVSVISIINSLSLVHPVGKIQAKTREITQGGYALLLRGRLKLPDKPGNIISQRRVHDFKVDIAVIVHYTIPET